MMEEMKKIWIQTNNLLKHRGSFFEKWEKDNRYLLKPFCGMLALLAFSQLTVILANFNYIDDLGRVVYGYRGWENFSRFTSAFLSKYIHTGTHLINISPLPQVIAWIFLATACTIVLKTFVDREHLRVWHWLAVLPLGLNPYMQECLSYKFDSPYMALSVLASVAPLLFVKADRKVYGLAIILGSLIMCTTYQAASGIFPMMVVFVLYTKWLRKEDFRFWNFLLTSMVSYIIGLLLFKFLVMKPTYEGYVTYEMFSIKEMIPGYLKNLLTYYQRVRIDFRHLWKAWGFVIVLLFFFRGCLDSKQNKAITLLGTGLVLGLSGLLTFGFYSCLVHPLVSPRAMYGLGALIALIGVNSIGQKVKYLSRLATFALTWCFLTLSLSFGNALADQKAYTQLRTGVLLADLQRLELSDPSHVKKVQMVNGIGLAPTLRSLPAEDEILRRLVPRTLGGGWAWSQYMFYHYTSVKGLTWTNDDLSDLDLPLIEDNMYETIYGDENYLRIEFKE